MSPPCSALAQAVSEVAKEETKDYNENQMRMYEGPFIRACPKCGRWWVSQKKWKDETTQISKTERLVAGVRRNVKNGKIVEEHGAFTMILRLRRHDCGGEMYDEGVEKNFSIGVPCPAENRKAVGI